MELQGKVALVTGGGTGLGREVSLRLAGAGAHVAICYPEPMEEAEATLADLRALGSRSLGIRADVSRDAEVRAMVSQIVSSLGRIDILVNNAGTTVFVPFDKLDEVAEADWDRVMDVNVKGAFFCSRAVAPFMKAQGQGKIVSITSTSGIRPGGSSIPYSVSKAGGTMLVKCLALALAPEITVNAVAPGLMDTKWGRQFGQATFDAYTTNSPLQRVPAIGDIAEAVLFLVRNDSMTGQTVLVNSGRYMP